MTELINRSDDATQSLTIQDFARQFGTSIDGISSACCKLINEHDFGYRPLVGDERDQVLLEVLKRIDSNQFSQAGRERKERWEKGWAENRGSFLEGGRDPSHLIPKYIRPGQPVRINQQYAATRDLNFELNWYEVFRLWLYQTYLADVGTVYEFGCGSGFNLAALAQLYPDKTYYGLDWATASVDIVNELGKTYGWDMHGLPFDFFTPDRSIHIEDNSAVLTIVALEQTGTNHGSFFQYLLDSSPKLCVHVEPVIEWYDENNLIDYTAIKYQSKRNYLRGLPERLKKLEEAGQIEILKAQRSYFGSLYLEGYSQLIWRPLK